MGQSRRAGQGRRADPAEAKKRGRPPGRGRTRRRSHEGAPRPPHPLSATPGAAPLDLGSVRPSPTEFPCLPVETSAPAGRDERVIIGCHAHDAPVDTPALYKR